MFLLRRALIPRTTLPGDEYCSIARKYVSSQRSPIGQTVKTKRRSSFLLCSFRYSLRISSCSFESVRISKSSRRLRWISVILFWFNANFFMFWRASNWHPLSPYRWISYQSAKVLALFTILSKSALFLKRGDSYSARSFLK